MTAHAEVIDRAIRLVPANAVVSVENGVGSHLSARRVVYLFPYVDDAQYVVIDLARYRPGSRVRATALAFSRNRDYSLLFSDDGVTVYRRVH